MKKIIIFFIVMVLVISKSALAYESLVGVTIGVEISFGKHSQNCDARGICNVKINIDFDDKSKSGSSITWDEGNGILTISTSNTSLKENQPDKLVDFEGKSSYDILEDWVAPIELNKALKVSKPITIKAGKYPLVYKNGVYSIIVKR